MATEDGLTHVCPRCEARVVLPTEKQLAKTLAARAYEAKLMAGQFPSLAEGFRAWLAGEAYYTQWGYRLKADRVRKARWSTLVRKCYPTVADFDEAARAWAAGRSGLKSAQLSSGVKDPLMSRDGKRYY